MRDFVTVCDLCGHIFCRPGDCALAMLASYILCLKDQY